MHRRTAAVLLAGVLAVGLGGCGSGRQEQTATSHNVNEQAIILELSRELPGFQNNPAFQVEVLNLIDLCQSSAQDFAIGASYAGSADQKDHLRRQIRAGCRWRSRELEVLLARQNRGTGRS